MADSPGSGQRQFHASQRPLQQSSALEEDNSGSARRDHEGSGRRRSLSPARGGVASTAVTPGAGESSSSATSSKARSERKRPSSPNWDEATSGGHPGEESMILRRREANRLAAQRFRNRKKGYQDSLEERIRVLEEERAVLTRRLEDAEDGLLAGRGYPGPHGSEHLMRRFDPNSGMIGGAPSRSASTSRLSRFASPSAADAELRVASLESANRRLQDELKRASERISYLEANLDQWIKWEQNLRYHGADAPGEMQRRPSPRQPSPRMAVPTSLPPPLPLSASPIVRQGPPPLPPPRRPVSPVHSPPRAYGSRSPHPSAPPRTAPPATPSYSAPHYGRERSSSVGMGGPYHGRPGAPLPPLPPPHGLSPTHPQGGPGAPMYSPYHERPPPAWSPPRDLSPHGPRGHPPPGHNVHPGHNRRYD